MKKPEKRYQDCNVFVKFWRRRHYLWIPVNAIGYYVNNQDSFFHCFSDCWSFATGMAQVKMNWVYDMEDLAALHHPVELDVEIISEWKPKNE